MSNIRDFRNISRAFFAKNKQNDDWPIRAGLIELKDTALFLLTTSCGCLHSNFHPISGGRVSSFFFTYA